ncbi:MAG: hypothetical protein VW405_17170, partial [Rhodospirillaceae bacterium]
VTLFLVLAAFFCVGVATVHFSRQSVSANEQRQIENLDSAAREAVTAIEQFIGSRQRLVETFAIEKSALLSALAADVENEAVRGEIAESLQRWFPNHFAFTIADRNGRDLIDNLDGFVGQACQANIREFTTALAGPAHAHASYEAVIHPQPGAYHFDVMAPWRTAEVGTLLGVFFVSFYPEAVQNIIRSYQGADHHLVLVNSDRRYLIEISADGEREQISAKRDIRLTPE